MQMLELHCQALVFRQPRQGLGQLEQLFLVESSTGRRERFIR